ncbi:alpha/beta hydrolase [Rhodococcus sp. NPDC058521]|uniref:poly(ethylene terephthalate) hydrolase family protein n=1 Tax=Rhodococcus sp. NPDC058521 TaxID=3346536 RepID=UPI0036582A27
MPSSSRLLAVTVCALASLLVPSGISHAQPASVSDRFAAPGTAEVEKTVVPGTPPPSSCQFGGISEEADKPDPDVAMEVFSPAELGDSAAAHPVITFGNGSCATSKKYEPFLRHLASWGYVVTVANSDGTGDGVEMSKAMDWVIEQNSNPASPFHNRIDTEHIGVLGHSQGAGGAVNATLHSAGRITSTALMNLPDPRWVNGPGHDFDISRLESRTFMTTGSDDPVSTGAEQSSYFDALRVPSAKGQLVGVGHNWAPDGEGFRGYITAWFEHTLRANPEAAAAFVGGSPELLDDQLWDQQAVVRLED